MPKADLETSDGRTVKVSLEAVPGADRDNIFLGQYDDVVAKRIDLETLGPGQGWIGYQNRITPFYSHVQGDAVTVWVHGRTYAFRRTDRTPQRTGAAASGGIRDKITAPMPGTILKIMVAAGDTITAHQPLIVLESMKMEMTLSAPHPGRVRDISCREGQLVEMGATLLRLQAG